MRSTNCSRRTDMTERTVQMNAYSELLKCEQWIAFSNAVKARDGHKCQNCGTTSGPLHAHHRQYHKNARTHAHVLPWKYPLKALVTLCSDCHNLGHATFKVPVFFV